LRVGGTHGRLLHRVHVSLLQLGHAGDRQVELVRARALDAGRRPLRRRHGRVQRGDHGVGRRARPAKVRRARVAQVTSARVAAHLGRVHQHLVGVMGGGMVVRQRMVRLVLVVLVWRFVEGRGPGVVERAPVVVRIISVGRRVLLARMRVLWRVIDIVVRSYSVVARQRASDTWVPPERTALAGRRALNGKNLIDLSPAGLRRGEAAA